MALTINLTKVEVTEPMEGMFNIVINMTCLDGIEEVINQDFTVRKKNEISLDIVKERVRIEMQEVIDRYKREQQLLNRPQLDAAIADVESALIG